MITKIKDLDRKILDYVNRKDYLALLFTNKYISSLFDDIFFRNKLQKEFNFNCKIEPKKYYNIVYSLNNINNLLRSNQKISIICKFSEPNDTFWSKNGLINWSFSEIQYSQNRDEICLYIGMTYNPVLFTTNVNHEYEKIDYYTGEKIEYTKYKVLNVKYDMFYCIQDCKSYDMFILTCI